MTHLDRVHSLACVLCTLLGLTQRTPTAAHHIREGQGLSQRAYDMLAAALCWDCHQGPTGVHGDRSRLRLANVTELGLVNLTLMALYVVAVKCAPTRRQRAAKRKGSTDRPLKMLERRTCE